MGKKESIDFDIFEIDLSRLDEEWINQPKMYFEYSEELTAAKEEAARCIARLDVANDDRRAVRADLDIRIRKNPDKYLKNIKPTETAITNRIIIHPKYSKAKRHVYEVNEALIKANKKVSTFYSAVNAINHRKAALERCVSLHGQNYFSKPQAKDEASSNAVNDIKKKAARKKKRSRKK